MSDFPRLVNISNGQTIEITSDQFSVGRSLKSSYVMNSVYISRTHFILEKKDGTWFLRDNSSNGTHLNGQVISYGRTRTLHDGDLIKIYDAETEFKFELFPVDQSSITDEQLCEVLDSVVSVKSQDIDHIALNEHCYDVQLGIGAPDAINEVIISGDGVEASNLIVPGPLPSTSSNCNIPNERKRVSSPEKPPCSENSTEISVKKSRSASTEKNSKQKGSEEKVPQLAQVNSQEKNKDKTDMTKNFDMAEEEMQCSICSEMFIKAVTLNCCHTFCKFCINQWKKQQGCCPICRNPISSMAPTLVLDNFIEKLVSQMDDKTQQHRKEMIEYRIAAENPQKTAAPSTSKTRPGTSSTTTSGGTTSTSATSHVSTVTISSDEDYDDYSGDEYSGFYDDSDDEDYDDYEYNGMPGKYYGGYGRCYRCHRRGHWANGCPYR